MTDFFYELAAKNLGTANVVVPRRPALFESETVPPHFQSVSESESISTFDDVNLVESRPARRQERISNTVEESAFPSHIVNPAPSPASRRTLRDAETEPWSHHISSISPKDVKHNPGQNLSRPRALPGEDSKVADQPRAIGSIVEPKLHRVPVPPRSNADERRKRDDNQTAEVKTQIIAKPRVAVARDREGPNPHAPSNVASKLLDEQPEKSETPVINITIGRVEVRALPSSAANRAAKTQPPTVSLDEYLQRRRNGGAR